MKLKVFLVLASLPLCAQQPTKDSQEFTVPKKAKKCHKSRSELMRELLDTAGDIVQGSCNVTKKVVAKLNEKNVAEEKELLKQICKTQAHVLQTVREVIEQDTVVTKKLQELSITLSEIKTDIQKELNASSWRALREKVKNALC